MGDKLKRGRNVMQTKSILLRPPYHTRTEAGRRLYRASVVSRPLLTQTLKSPVLRPAFFQCTHHCTWHDGAPTRYAFVRFRVKASAILPAGKRTTGSAESPQLLPLSIQKSELACTCSACVEHVVSACFDRSFSSTMLAQKREPEDALSSSLKDR